MFLCQDIQNGVQSKERKKKQITPEQKCSQKLVVKLQLLLKQAVQTPEPCSEADIALVAGGQRCHGTRYNVKAVFTVRTTWLKTSGVLRLRNPVLEGAGVTDSLINRNL